MKLSYTLDNKDFLTYQLYIASKSESIRKKRRNTRMIIPLFYFAIGVFLLMEEKSSLVGILFVLFGLIWLIFYPKYSSYYYKKHYQKHIDQHYQNRIGLLSELEFASDLVQYKDHTSEGKIKAGEFEECIELKDHFFLKMKRDTSLIIPKDQIPDLTIFKQKMEELEIDYLNESNWEWK